MTSVGGVPLASWQERQNWMRIAMEQEAARVRAESERDNALRMVEMEQRGKQLAEVSADTERAAMENARADAEAHAEMVQEAQERTRAYALVTADLIERERVIADSFRAREHALLASHPHPPVPWTLYSQGVRYPEGGRGSLRGSCLPAPLGII